MNRGVSENDGFAGVTIVKIGIILLIIIIKFFEVFSRGGEGEPSLREIVERFRSIKLGALDLNGGSDILSFFLSFFFVY